MHCEGGVKLSSHNTSYCLIDVVTKAGLTVHKKKRLAIPIYRKSILASVKIIRIIVINISS